MKQAHDWPLSRGEKQSCLFRLYDKDLSTANSLLSSSEVALQTLRAEVATLASGGKEGAGKNCPIDAASKDFHSGCSQPQERNTNVCDDAAAEQKCAMLDQAAADEKRRLRQALASTAAQFEQLSALLVKMADDSDSDGDHNQRMRARSEGAAIKVSSGALRQPGRRHSRGSRRVSWADEPEPEADSPAIAEKAGTLAIEPLRDACSDPVENRSVQSHSRKSALQSSPSPCRTGTFSRDQGSTSRGRQLAGSFRFGASVVRSIQDTPPSAPSNAMDFL